MDKSNRSEQKKSIDFWNKLNEDVRTIETRAQNRSRHNQFGIDKQFISLELRKQSRSAASRRMTRFQLDEAARREKEEGLIIENRIKYLQLESQRMKKNTETARRKYERIVQIRNKSMKQKQQLHQKIHFINDYFIRDATTRAEKVRKQREKTSHSIQRVKLNNSAQAERVRLEKIQNEESIKAEKQLEAEQKKTKVQNVQESQQLSRCHVLKYQQDRIQRGKETHKQMLISRFRINEISSKKNMKLKIKLQQSIDLVSQARMRSSSELKHYEAYLRLNRKRNIVKEKEKEDIFYLTER